MPVYEFKCGSRGALIECLMRVDAPPPECARCDGDMQKQVSRTNFQLNGAGWARDNYGLTADSSE